MPLSKASVTLRRPHITIDLTSHNADINVLVAKPPVYRWGDVDYPINDISPPWTTPVRETYVILYVRDVVLIT